MQLLTANKDIAGMEVAMQAYLANAASALVASLDAVEHELSDPLVSLDILVRNEIVIEQVFDGIGAVAVNIDARPMIEAAGFAFEMNASDQPAELLLQLEVIEIGRATAVTAINREAVVPAAVQGRALMFECRHDRDFLRLQRRGKRMLFENRGVGPASRAIELRNDRWTVFDANLVDAIFVTVERQETAVAAKSQRGQRGEDVLWLQVSERQRRRVVQEAFLDSRLRSDSFSSFLRSRRLDGVISRSSSSSRNSSDCSSE